MSTLQRITIQQTPYVERYVTALAGKTGLSKADLYNTAVQVMSVLVGAYAQGKEYALVAGGSVHEDPVLKVLLGDIITELGGEVPRVPS